MRIVVAASATVSQFTTTRAIGKNIMAKLLLPLCRYLADHSTFIAAKTMLKLDALLCYAAIAYTRRQVRTAEWGAAALTAVSLLAVSKMAGHRVLLIVCNFIYKWSLNRMNYAEITFATIVQSCWKKRNLFLKSEMVEKKYFLGQKSWVHSRFVCNFEFYHQTGFFSLK